MVDEGMVTAYEAAGILKQSQRAEVSQASYSDLIKVVQGNDGAGGTIANTDIANRVLDSTAEYMTPGSLVGMRKETMKLIADHMGSKMQAAYQAASSAGATDDDKLEFAKLMGTFSGMRDTINSHAQHLSADFASGFAGVKLGSVVREVQDIQRDATGAPILDKSGRPKIKIVHKDEDLTVRQYEDALKQGVIKGGNIEDITRLFLDRRREWSVSDIASNGGAPPQPPGLTPPGGGTPAGGNPSVP